MVPEKGPLIKKDLPRVVTCSHLATEIRSSPPSPLGSFTWVGAGRR